MTGMEKVTLTDATPPDVKRKKKKPSPMKGKYCKQGALTPQDAEASQKWVKPVRNRPVAGVVDPFIMATAQKFARGEIDYLELKYRLQHGKASRGKSRIATDLASML